MKKYEFDGEVWYEWDMVESNKLVANGWVERGIGFYFNDEEYPELVIDTNAVVGTVYEKSYMGFDGFLKCSENADDILAWLKDEGKKYQK